MSKPEWGVKRACLACGTRFYDMQKSPIVCPKCGTVFEAEAIFRPRRARVEEEAPQAANDDAKKKKAAKASEDDIDDLVDDDIEIEDDDDDDALAGDDDLDDDDDDVTAVKPVGEDDD